MAETVKPKRKAVNSKQKGNSFEGKIAKMLTAALSPLCFMRSPSSGARLGGKNFQKFGALFGEEAIRLFSADVVPTNEKDTNLVFKFSIECKFYASSDSFETIVAGNSHIFGWMKESIVDAQKTQKIPIVVFKWNRSPIYVAALKDSNIAPNQSKITLTQDGMSIEIFYLDDIIKNKNIWIENV